MDPVWTPPPTMQIKKEKNYVFEIRLKMFALLSQVVISL
jgi:hypothetical protein